MARIYNSMAKDLAFSLYCVRKQMKNTMTNINISYTNK